MEFEYRLDSELKEAVEAEAQKNFMNETLPKLNTAIKNELGRKS